MTDTVTEPPKKKGKKRPSDFEILRTITTRSHERKLPFVLKNMGEDADVLLLCSADEDSFTYGSPETAIALIEWTDPELKTAMTTILNSLYGWDRDTSTPLVINLRDQMSELAKTKGECNECPVLHHPAGSTWTVKTDKNGRERTIYFTKAIDSLFHMRIVSDWCQTYRPLLSTADSRYLYYPYTHPQDAPTASVLTLPPSEQSTDWSSLFPHGFRQTVVRGQDVLLDKFLLEFPYPVLQEDCIVLPIDGVTCQCVHRIIADGWRMVVVRPYHAFFPTFQTILPTIGHPGL